MAKLSIGPARYIRGGFVEFARYGNGETAIRIVGEDGQQEAVASINVEPYGAPAAGPRRVWLKGWSENEGIPEALEKAGICKRTGERFPLGFVAAELAELSDAARSQAGLTHG